MRLYRSKEHPTHWIGEDEHAALVIWPAAPRGWTKRTPYTGARRALEEVPAALARGSGWPGGGRGPAPRAGGAASRKRGIRVADHEWAAWEHAAEIAGRTVSDWIRDTCNTTAAAAAGSGRGKGKP